MKRLFAAVALLLLAGSATALERHLRRLNVLRQGGTHSRPAMLIRS
jgi:hypothetical protein